MDHVRLYFRGSINRQISGDCESSVALDRLYTEEDYLASVNFDSCINVNRRSAEIADEVVGADRVAVVGAL